MGFPLRNKNQYFVSEQQDENFIIYLWEQNLCLKNKQTDSIACPESHFPHSVGANTLKTNKLVKLVNSFTISQAQLMMEQLDSLTVKLWNLKEQLGMEDKLSTTTNVQMSVMLLMLMKEKQGRGDISAASWPATFGSFCYLSAQRTPARSRYFSASSIGI